MADITNAGSIPVAKRDTIKAVCVQIGPQLVPAVYPVDGNGDPLTSLTNAQAATVFEHITRKFWRDQITAYEAQQAAEAARQQAITDNSADPFDG